MHETPSARDRPHSLATVPAAETGPPPGAAGATLQRQALPHGSSDEEPAAPMSEAAMRQAFAEIAENYEEISREVLGDDPALSADLFPEHHTVRCR